MDETGYPATPGLEYATRRVLRAIAAGDKKAIVEGEMQRRVQGFEVLRSALQEIAGGLSAPESQHIALAALIATELPAA